VIAAECADSDDGILPDRLIDIRLSDVGVPGREKTRPDGDEDHITMPADPLADARPSPHIPRQGLDQVLDHRV